MTGKVFLNYRRADAEAWADRLFERLVRHYPHEHVFMDIDGAIPFGFPWDEWLDRQVADCDLMLVLIGRNWISEFQVRTGPDERDYVRVEIESALARKIPVVPVLLGEALFPKSADLPESIRPLLRLQAHRLQRSSFDGDVEVLVTGIARSIALTRQVSPRDQAANPSSSSSSTPKRHESQGNRIPVDAPILHGSLDGRLEPGAGTSEWFRDIDIGPEMAVVPAGTFTMGSHGYGTEKPPHDVTFARPFAVGRFPVLRGQFAAFVAATGRDMGGGGFGRIDGEWRHDTRFSWLDPGFPQRDDHPVVCVSWEDAAVYAAWLGARTGKSYRLLTEAEWEYCCGATTKTFYSTGDEITSAQANFDNHEKGTTPAQKYPPNPWGLFDMHGNVWEWCQDYWNASYQGAPTDGAAWQAGNASLRVARGGSWLIISQMLRTALRGRVRPDARVVTFGFRVARDL